jgi:hypothetical protein
MAVCGPTANDRPAVITTDAGTGMSAWGAGVDSAPPVAAPAGWLGGDCMGARGADPTVSSPPTSAVAQR